MFNFPSHIKKFLLIAYTFSSVLWLAGWAIADRLNVAVLINSDLYNWAGDNDVLLVSLLFAIATLGPFIGALVVRRESGWQVSADGVPNALFVGGLFALATAIFALLTSFSAENERVYGFGYVAFALLYFALTSSTEEFGWRGVLYPHIRKHSKSLWDSAFYTGLIWGPWHTAFVLYLFVNAGMPLIAIVLNYLGFIFTTVLMSYLHGWVAVRSQSVFANYLLHTLHNWIPILFIFLLGQSPLATIISIAAYLSVVFFLEKRHPSTQYFAPQT